MSRRKRPGKKVREIGAVTFATQKVKKSPSLFQNQMLNTMSSGFTPRPTNHPEGYYVYLVYEVSSNDKILRYVGKGKLFRAWVHQERIAKLYSDLLQGNSIDKYSALYKSLFTILIKSSFESTLNVEILSEGLEENEAFEIEKNIIRLAGKAIDGNGTLFSLADGGKSIGNNYFDSIGDIKSYGVNDRLSKQDKASREFLHHYAAGIQ